MLVRGDQSHVQDLREQIAIVLEPLGLRLSEAKTQILHMSEGFDFLGFHIQWRRKRGTNKWYVYTFIAKRPFASVKAKIRAQTPRTSQQDLRAVLIRVNQITRGWSNYFKHAVAQRTFSHLQQYTWWRIVRMMRTRHRWRWKDVRRWLTDPNGRWKPISADGIELFNPEAIADYAVSLPGQADPQPLGASCVNQAPRQEPWRARCVETRTAGSASGLGKRTGSNAGTAPQADSSVGLSSACRPALDALVHSVPQADGGTSGIRCHLSCRDSLIPEAAGVVSCRRQLRRLSPRAGAVTRRAQSHSCGAHRFAGLG